MGKKAIKYLIIFLVIPVLIAISIAIITGGNEPSDSYNSMSGSNGRSDYLDYEDQIKENSNNPVVYLGVFMLVMITAGVWIYVKKKGEI